MNVNTDYKTRKINNKIIPTYYYGKNAASGMTCRNCLNAKDYEINITSGKPKSYICEKRIKAGEPVLIKKNFLACDDYFERKY